MKRRTQSKLAVTMGDPNGVGPEITLKAIAGKRIPDNIRLFIFGDPDVYRRIIEARNLDVELPTIRPSEIPECTQQHVVVALRNCRRATIRPGNYISSNAKLTLESIHQATLMTIAGLADAVVTNPINKSIFKDLDLPFPGHTQYIHHLCEEQCSDASIAPEPVMCMISPHLSVALVTDHIPLAEVSSSITTEKIVQTAVVVNDDCRLFGLKEPRIAVCGLNPHAGEGGMLGNEDEEIILPAVETLIKKGIQVEGPLSSDTIFHRMIKKDFNFIIALYHDQGLIAIKTIDFNSTVNVTLGLPIIRTSVDHGTAYDLADSFQADTGSLVHAINLAAKMADNL